MKKIITLQPSAYTDQLTDDGTELTKLPYPFHVDAETGNVERQDLWQGKPRRVIGLQHDISKRQVDLWWDKAVNDPQQVVGMYIITQDDDGSIATHLSAVANVVVLDESEGR